MKSAIDGARDDVEVRARKHFSHANLSTNEAVIALSLLRETGHLALAADHVNGVLNTVGTKPTEVVEISPICFEILVDAGRLTEACNLLHQVFESLQEQSCEKMQLQRWVNIAIRAGARLSLAQNYCGGLELFRSLIEVAGDDLLRTTGDHERSLRLLAASVALKAAEELSSVKRVPSSEWDQAIKFSDLNTSVLLARDANDTEASVLSMKSSLLTRDVLSFGKALDNLCRSERDPSSFLCSFAVDAWQAGLEDAFLQCVRGIFEGEVQNLNSWATEGFLGSLLVASVSIEYERLTASMATDRNSFQPLESLLQKGADLLRTRGLKPMFHSLDEEQQEVAILVDICWNLAIGADERELLQECEVFFELCLVYSGARRTTLSSLRTCFLASVFLCSSLLRMMGRPSSINDSICSRAIDAANEVRRQIDLLSEFCNVKDVALYMETWVSLSVRLACLMKDEQALESIIDEVLRKFSPEPHFVVKLAASVMGWSEQSDTAQSSFRRSAMTLATECFQASIDLYLASLISSSTENDNSQILESVAAAYRELLMVVVSLHDASGMDEFRGAQSLASRYPETFPAIEMRWLACFAWERARYHELGQNYREAKEWMEEVRRVIQISPRRAGLAGALSEVEAFLNRNNLSPANS